jgi:hypothetical protein
MITLFEKFNFRIINKNWSEPNKDDINKYKLYSEFIITKFFNDENLANLKIEIFSNNFYLNVEFFTMNLKPQTFILISKYCEFIKTIGRYNIYVEKSEGDDSIMGIESEIDTSKLEKIIKTDKYNI